MYHSAQRQFIDFCTLDGYASSNGLLLPASEQTLMRFCSHLADRLHHSSIKVYLSAIRSLLIYQGFPDPLVNCLQLQRLLRGIKHHQGSSLPQCQPVTADLMQIIQRSLDAHNSEHIMLWAACCLGFFGFLRAGEFTVNCTFDSPIHLTVQDLQVDAEVHIKSSKTDHFRQGCFIYLGRGQAPFCPVSAILAYLHRQGPSSGPLFIDTHGQPLTRSRLSSFIQSVLRERESLGNFRATAFELGLPPQPRNAAFQITLLRPWAAGPVMLINSTLEPQWNQFWKFLASYFSNRYLSRVVVYTYVYAPSGLAIRGSSVSQPRAPFSPSLSAMARRSLRLGVGAHGWVALLCQSWGHYFNLGSGCQ